MSSNLVDIRHVVNYFFGYASYFEFLKTANDVYPEATKMQPAFVHIQDTVLKTDFRHEVQEGMIWLKH